MCPAIFNRFRLSISNFFHTYSTVKEIEIHHTYIAIIYRLLQFAVISYIGFHIVWVKKGYQEVQEPFGSSVIKVKGVARASTNNSNRDSVDNKRVLWDAAEYLISPLENNAFFIATRKIITYDQTIGSCPSALIDNLFCNDTHNLCQQGTPSPNAIGFLTGNCVPSLTDSSKNVCEINAWCPEELSNSTDYTMTIDDLQNFPEFLKTMVAFSQYNINIRTVKDNTNFSCRYHSKTDRRCPIFSIGYILKQLSTKDYPAVDFKALYQQGGLIEIEQTWKCNFDFVAEHQNCFPKFNFNLLQSGSDELSPGINYRFTEKYHINGVEYRTLTKIYGLRFVLSIRGEGRRFDIVHLFLALGSGVGYMMIAEVICDFIFSKCHKYRRQYRDSKVNILNLGQVKKTNSERLRLVCPHDSPKSPVLSREIYESDV